MRVLKNTEEDKLFLYKLLVDDYQLANVSIGTFIRSLGKDTLTTEIYKGIIIDTNLETGYCKWKFMPDGFIHRPFAHIINIDCITLLNY